MAAHTGAFGCGISRSGQPVVKDAVDHQPLHLDAKAQVLLLQLRVHGVLVLPLHALVLLPVAKINGWRLVHVVLPLVVPEHHLTVQLQLWEEEVEVSGREDGTTVFEFFWVKVSTWSSVTQEQCQYDMLDHLAKNSLSGRPARGAGSGASAGRSGGRGTGVGGGASPHRHVRIFWTLPFIGGH